jgi:hypothetical protein
MFESAINPAYWWGATAVSSPILIHLINRLRFKRIRWAAMEFLLKAQLRNRRRLIIEQLVLLALRCFIVMLVVSFLVRPQWLLGDTSARKTDLPFFHVALLDDSLSMRDDEEDAQKTAFRNGVELLSKIATDASESPHSHYLTILKVSAPEVPELGRTHGQLAGGTPGVQLTADEVGKLGDKLKGLDPTYFRLDPKQMKAALDQADLYFANVQEGNKILHVFSDFRGRDWGEADADEVWRALAKMARERGVIVRPYDIARPQRPTLRTEKPGFHPNVAITNVVARTKDVKEKDRSRGASANKGEVPVQVIAPGVPFVLRPTIRNYSPEPVRVRVGVKVDGKEKSEFSSVFDVAPKVETEVDLDFRFSKSEDGLGRKRLALYVELTTEPGKPDRRDHLPVDNVRYLALDVKEEIPVLLIDPEHERNRDYDASYRVQSALRGTKLGLKTETMHPRTIADEKVKLDEYSVIYVMNIAGVGDGSNDMPADGLKKLENYVNSGGSVVFFLGEHTNVVRFNAELYRNGEGIFPVPLSERPEPEKSSSYNFVDDVPDNEDLAPKIRFLRENDPIFQFRGDLLDTIVRAIYVNRYFQVNQAHATWNAQKDRVVELVQLANRRPLTGYRVPTAELVRDIQRAAGAEFAGKMRDYLATMDNHVFEAEKKRARKGPLLEAMGGMLSDPGLADFWKQPANKELRDRVQKFYQVLQTGDPLVVEARYGAGKHKGTVVAFMSTAGPVPTGDTLGNIWNNMASNPFFFQIMFLFGHQYLAGETMKAKATETNLIIQKETILRLNKERYNDKMEVYFQRDGDAKPPEPATVTGREEGEDYVFAIVPKDGPGNYLLKLNVSKEGSTAKGEPEDRVISINVDSTVEGDLARPSDEDLANRVREALRGGFDDATAYAQRFKLLTSTKGTEEEIVQARSWSDYSWLILLFLGVLLLEQFLGMLFSHHVRDGQEHVPVRMGRVPVMAGNVELETVSAS